jgi:hypothetical protein
MNQLQTAAAIVGSILLGASVFLIGRQESEPRETRRRRRPDERPVDELAENLKEAWAVYHTP